MEAIATLVALPVILEAIVLAVLLALRTTLTGLATNAKALTVMVTVAAADTPELLVAV